MKKLLVSLLIAPLLIIVSPRAYPATKEIPLTYAPNWIYKVSFKLKLNITKDGKVSGNIEDVKPAMSKAYLWMKFNTWITKVFWYDECIHINFDLRFQGQGRAVNIPFNTPDDPSTYQWDSAQKGLQTQEWNENSTGVDASFCIKDYPELAGMEHFVVVQPQQQTFTFGTPSQESHSSPCRLQVLKGLVRVKKAHGKWLTARKGMELSVGDTVKTLSNAQATIVLQNGTVVTLKPGTQTIIPEDPSNTHRRIGFLKLTWGVLMARARKIRESFKIATPHAICGLRGTQFEVSYLNDTSCVKVFEHSVWFSDPAEKHTVIVHEGEESCIKGDGIPSKPASFDNNQSSEGTQTNISGKWSSNFGEITFRQRGDKVEGEYTHDKGRIEGILSGYTLTGKWMEEPTYKPPHDAGDMQLTFSVKSQNSCKNG